MTSFKYLNRIQFLARFVYVGSRFYGVQEQPGLPTVLGALRQRIEETAQQPAKALFVAARTDRGVSALENYATFYLRPPLDCAQFKASMQAFQGDGLYITSIDEVSPKVHARGNALGKVYRYYIQDGHEERPLLTHPFIWNIAPKLSIDNMKTAAGFLIGEMDFSSLRGGGCEAGSTIKKIIRIEIMRWQNRLITIEIEGNSFLRRMIRNLVGLLVEVGAGLRPPSTAEQILLQQERSAAGIMAPAQGLCLIKVDFKY